MSAVSATRSCRLDSPIDALSSSAVPSATTLPVSMTAMRSASWSASSRYCVVRSTVEPLATRSRMVSHICPRVRGSSPVVGSSRKMSGGCAMRDAARSRRRRMPPEKFLRGRFAASVRPNRSSSSAALRRESARESPSRRPKSMRFSLAERCLVDGRVLPGHADELTDDLRLLDDVVAEDASGAAVGTQQRREHADGGGLAGAVGSEDAVDGAGLDAEVDAVDRPVLAEHLHEPLGLDGPVSGGSCHVTSIRAPALSRRCRPAVTPLSSAVAAAGIRSDRS